MKEKIKQLNEHLEEWMELLLPSAVTLLGIVVGILCSLTVSLTVIKVLTN